MTISNGLASDRGSESIERSGSTSSGFSSSGVESSVFSAGLVEPGSDVSLPVFSEVYIGDGVVMFNHWR